MIYDVKDADMAKKRITVTSVDERRWQAESDAETLARYEEIMADPSRRRAAVSAAKTRAADLRRRADAMARASGSSSGKASGR